MLTCKDCHFLAVEYRTEPGHPMIFSLTPKEREDLKTVSKHGCLLCHRGVWAEGISGAPDIDREKTVYETPRKRCFFFPHSPNMFFPAAAELQKREQEYEALRRSNRYTRVALYISSGALGLNLLLALGKALAGYFSKPWLAP